MKAVVAAAAVASAHDPASFFVVFGVFVLLTVVLAVLVVRFSVKLNRERNADARRRPGRGHLYDDEPSDRQ